MTLFVRQGRGAVAIAAEQDSDLLERQGVGEGQKPEHERTPVLRAHGPARQGLRPQRVVHRLRDGAAVLGSGESVVAAPSPQHPVRRSA